MAVPARRTSKTRKRIRRSHIKLEVNGLIACPNCGEKITSHTVCPHCGFYDGKDVLGLKKQAEKTEAKKAAKPAKEKKVKEPKVTEQKAIKAPKAIKEKINLAIEKGKTGDK